MSEAQNLAKFTSPDPIIILKAPGTGNFVKTPSAIHSDNQSHIRLSTVPSKR
jgi:hypothetical protein